MVRIALPPVDYLHHTALTDTGRLHFAPGSDFALGSCLGYSGFESSETDLGFATEKNLAVVDTDQCLLDKALEFQLMQVRYGQGRQEREEFLESFQFLGFRSQFVLELGPELGLATQHLGKLAPSNGHSLEFLAGFLAD